VRRFRGNAKLLLAEAVRETRRRLNPTVRPLGVESLSIRRWWNVRCSEHIEVCVWVYGQQRVEEKGTKESFPASN